jgi:ATP-dependent helicase/nuclease subunit A
MTDPADPQHKRDFPVAPPGEPMGVDDSLPADTNARQRLATEPGTSVWVAASAGTGKTSVLTRRVLRLLLPRPDGQPGTPPARILCLTFTKAAASEMKLRLTTTLAQWATLPLEAASPDAPSLTQELAKLLGRAPTAVEITAARRLFAAVVDTPGGLRIMTIHAFCTAILGTFPLEAGLPPQFRTLEDGPAAALMERARNDVLTAARHDQGGELSIALDTLAGSLSEDAFNALLQALAQERGQLSKVLDASGGPAGLHAALCQMLGITPEDDEASIIMDACRDGLDEPALRSACAALATGTEKSDQPRGLSLQLWLDMTADKRVEAFTDYTAVFLKKTDGEVLARLATKKVEESFPACVPALRAEAERLQGVQDRLKSVRCAAMTRQLFMLGGAILTRYQYLKDQRAALDFDDLILYTLNLLRRQDMVPWVMYKLDGGIDHILVDEAQDTNPEQWEIIRLLAQDFFTGSGARDDIRRTIFAVGDEKQSIYSFQRAAPEKFNAMRAVFEEQVRDANLPWRTVPLDMSFRSVPAVLRTVDATFAPDAARAGLGTAPLRHDSFRDRDGGLTALWPLFISPAQDKEELWSPPVAAGESHRAASHMARHIAATIKRWLDPANPEILVSQNRPVRAGDIMILVRTRTAFVNQLIRALKVEGVPVGGLDRMVLSQQLVSRDLAAVAQTALLPADDLTLACVLKSPFIGWTDADLEDLAAYRPAGHSLWQTLQARQSALVPWLARQQERAGTERPFEFFSRLVQEPCPGDPVSGQHAITGRLGPDSLDPLEEFLNAALAFEDAHIATLQDFLHDLSRNDSDIKREQEEAGDNVRIMTVHGSKGLQAPVVILPDTLRGTRGNKPGERLLWPEKSALPLPLWAPKAADECRAYAAGKATLRARMDEEYRRLLYVAMTRAEDRLYVAGFRNDRKHGDGSWYDLVAAALYPDGELAGTAAVPFAYPAVLDPAGRDVNAARQYAQEQKRPPQQKHARETREAPAAPRPDDPALRWLYHAPAPEPQPPQPLIPSRAAEDSTMEPAVASPLRMAGVPGTDSARFRRGTLIHRLLQIVPDIAPDRRRDAARRWMAQQNAADDADDVLQAVFAVLDDDRFAPLFAPGSLAEVPVTGVTPQGRLVSGQIDRLLVRGDEVWIVDYKTNRAPPADETGIPAVYREQMRAYAVLMARIYPGHKVRSFLLWTTDARIMEIVE